MHHFLFLHLLRDGIQSNCQSLGEEVVPLQREGMGCALGLGVGHINGEECVGKMAASPRRLCSAGTASAHSTAPQH